VGFTTQIKTLYNIVLYNIVFVVLRLFKIIDCTGIGVDL